MHNKNAIHGLNATNLKESAVYVKCYVMLLSVEINVLLGQPQLLIVEILCIMLEACHYAVSLKASYNVMLC